MLRRRTGSFAGLMTMLAVASTPAFGVTTTLTAGDWQGGTWDNGQPGLGDDAVIAAGVTTNANGSSGEVDPWSGTLTIEAGATLQIRTPATVTPTFLPYDGASTIFMQDGARILDRMANDTIPSDFVITGTAGMDNAGSTAGWNRNRIFTGTISGDTWTTTGYNHQGYTYQSANTFSEYLIEGGDRHGVGFEATGSAGLGDVTVNGRLSDGRSAVIFVEALNPFATDATLNLNGLGWAGSTGGFGPYASGSHVGTSARIVMNNDATIAELFIDGVAQPTGTYTGGDAPWILGSGNLIVTGTTPALPGDTDGDGDIDDADLGTSFSNYTGPLAPGTGGKTAAEGDTDGDGDVDDADLGTSFSGYTGPLAAAVPEPTSLALLGLGGLLVARRRRA